MPDLENHSDRSFYASFLGEFSLYYGDRKIQIDVNLQTKYMQILIRLLKAGADGIERMTLMGDIWPEEADLKKRMNNFRAQRFLLRKLIDRLAFPEGVYILRKKDRYYFSFDYEVRTDTGYLDELMLKLQADESETGEYQELLWSFYQSYPGSFLPALSMEAWVIQEDLHYRNGYQQYVGALYECLKKQGRFEEMLKLCASAGRIYPYDEWQMKEIDCLMALDRQTEAADVYEKASRIYYENFGTTALDKVMEQYSQAPGKLYCAANVLSDRKNELAEKNAEAGAYYCPYPSFLDAYHLMTRLTEGLNMNCILMICTVTEPVRSLEPSRTTLEAVKLLRKALIFSARKEDIVTQYSLNQFLVLMPGINQEESVMIAEQIEHRWNGMNRETDIAVKIEMLEAGCGNWKNHFDEGTADFSYTAE